MESTCTAGSPVIVGAVLVIGILAAPAVALDPFEQARWQIAANQARTTLLVPETPVRPAAGGRGGARLRGRHVGPSIGELGKL